MGDIKKYADIRQESTIERIAGRRPPYQPVTAMAAKNVMNGYFSPNTGSKKNRSNAMRTTEAMAQPYRRVTEGSRKETPPARREDAVGRSISVPEAETLVSTSCLFSTGMLRPPL